MKYQDIENEFYETLHWPSRWEPGDISDYFKTKMKEAMMEIIGEDLEKVNPVSAPLKEGFNQAKKEQRQRVNEFFEEEEK